jgi:putative endonuclease
MNVDRVKGYEGRMRKGKSVGEYQEVPERSRWGITVKNPAVYMLASQRNGTLYIGVTSDLIQRVWQHKEGLADSFTKIHNVKILVWYEQHETMESAISKEKSMKKWLREWKLKTIEQANPDWNDLWSEITGAVISAPSVIPVPDYPIRGQAAAEAQPISVIPSPLVIPASPVIPAQAGIQQNKNAFDLNPLDSRIRGNDEVGV